MWSIRLLAVGELVPGVVELSSSYGRIVLWSIWLTVEMCADHVYGPSETHWVGYSMCWWTSPITAVYELATILAV